MADYLSRFPSAAAPRTSCYDESFIVAKIKMINEALNPKAQMKPRGQNVKYLKPIPAVEGDQSCLDITTLVASNENSRTIEYLQIITVRVNAH